MAKHYRENWKTYHIAFIVITILVSFPDVFFWKTPGLDPSWRYALNELFCGGYICGQDFIFTYGFFGFLVNCVKIGHNMLITWVFWTIILGAHGLFLYQLLFKEKERQSFPTLVGLFLFIISSPSPEYYLVYVSLMSILLTMNGYRRDIYFFSFLLPISLYIKFSLFILILIISVIYLLFGYFQDRSLYRYCTPKICLSILLMPIVYFIFNGFSLSNFSKYIRGSLEIASGYSVAMSSSQHDVYLFWIIITATLCAVCLIMSIKCGMRNFMTFAFTCICLLMLYKHGFVRADNIHVPSCMNSMLSFLSLAVIFIDWKHAFIALGKWKSLFLVMFITASSILLIQNGLETANVFSIIKNKVFELPEKITDIVCQDDAGVSPLPREITELISDSTVCIYPWEISYCISNDLNYIPLATLQAYCAYTPYLDRITAQKFLDENAPEHIILTLDTADNRFPFIECPQTWEAIRNNYFALIEKNDIILLRHNPVTQSIIYEPQNITTQNIKDNIVLEGSDYIKITAQLNWKGKLAKMLWKIPEVDMTVYYTDKNTSPESGRVLLDLFSQGVEVGSIISHNNTEQFIDMINHEGELSLVDSLCLSGDGLSFYKDNITIEFFSSCIGD